MVGVLAARQRIVASAKTAKTSPNLEDQARESKVALIRNVLRWRLLLKNH